jgi:hypothetical protein
MPMTPFRSATLVFALVLAASLGAEEVRCQEISGALKFGPGVFTFAGEGDYQPLANLNAAFTTRLAFGALILQPEVQIVSRGGMLREASETTESSVRLDQNITYVDIPFLAGVVLGGPYTPVFYAGPYGGIRIDSQVRLQFNGGGFTPTVRDVNRWDAGLIAGTSAEFDTRFYRVVVDLRGLYGLAPVFVDEPSMRHFGAMLLVGIAF